MASSIKDQLKSFDAHSAVGNDFRIRTGNGALLSAFTMLSIAYFVSLEYGYNLNKERVSTVHVNATTPVGLKLEFDIDFPNIPCALLSVESEDPTGQPQSLHIDRTHRIFKHRLEADGKRKGRRSRFEMGNTLNDHFLQTTFVEKAKEQEAGAGDDEVGDEELCGSCYGAGEDDECCNTCDDVQRAYKTKGWHVQDLTLIKQCKHSKKSEDEEDEGCNIHGNVALDSGGGNFHIVPNRDLENFGHEKEMNIMDFFKEAFESYNVTHTINKFRFGRSFPGQVYQLDGQTRLVEDPYAMYQYYLQVVPSTYTALKEDMKRPYNTKISTFQFSVTEHLRHIGPRVGRGMPGVYFFYEVSPLHVEVSEVRRGWVHFFTSICAAIGGMFSVMSMLDKTIFEFTRVSNQLG